jgi:hypothetical protein
VGWFFSLGMRFSFPLLADFAWTVLARMLSFAKDRGIVAVNPCERGGRLYSGNRGRPPTAIFKALLLR